LKGDVRKKDLLMFLVDLFCYHGGFGLAAAVGGATSVVCVDSSAKAIETTKVKDKNEKKNCLLKTNKNKPATKGKRSEKWC
jgi:23S rRNA G2069 N7-methylase RlmK/C1962 C5-methylase RlmI